MKGHSLGSIGVRTGVGHGEDAWAGVGQLKVLVREFVSIDAAPACSADQTLAAPQLLFPQI